MEKNQIRPIVLVCVVLLLLLLLFASPFNCPWSYGCKNIRLGNLAEWITAIATSVFLLFIGLEYRMNRQQHTKANWDRTESKLREFKEALRQAKNLDVKINKHDASKFLEARSFSDDYSFYNFRAHVLPAAGEEIPSNHENILSPNSKEFVNTDVVTCKFPNLNTGSIRTFSIVVRFTDRRGDRWERTARMSLDGVASVREAEFGEPTAIHPNYWYVFPHTV